jgi:anti-sigma factor RsiW
MRCDEVTTVLPGLVDDDAVADAAVHEHVAACLRCQAELARYRKVKRALHELRTRYVEPAPGLLGETLAVLTDAAEKGAIRSMVTARRLAYAGAAVGTAALATGTALLIARSRRRTAA